MFFEHFNMSTKISVKNDAEQKETKTIPSSSNVDNRRLTNGQRCRNYFKEQCQNVEEHVGDMSPIPHNTQIYFGMVRVYSWVIVCLGCWSITKFIRFQLVLYSLTSTYLTVGFVFVTLFTLPLLIFHLELKLAKKLQIILLLLTILDPVIVNYSNVHSKISTPSAFLPPSSILMIIRLVGPSFGDIHRKQLLITLMTPSCIMFLVYAFATNSLKLSYCLWAASLVAMATFDFQLKTVHFRDGCINEGCVVYEQFVSILRISTVTYIFTRLYEHLDWL